MTMNGLAHALYVDEEALERASEKQRAAHRRIQRRYSVRGVLLLSDGTLQIGYETLLGRDREAIIGANGQRLDTRNTWSHAV